MRNRTILFLALAWLSGCNTNSSGSEPEGAAGTAVARSSHALSNASAWQGSFDVITGSGSTTFDCDSVVSPAFEEEPDLPITIIPGADESFTLQLAGCQFRYSVAGSQASYSGQQLCSERSPDGYVIETTYRSGTIQRRADGTLFSRTLGDVAFGPLRCSFVTSASYQRVEIPI